jgi:phage shock protein A
MKKMNKNQQKVYLRTQVKIAEKKLKSSQEKEQLISNKIRVALRAGERAAAEKLAPLLNEAREDLDFAKKQLGMAKNFEAKAVQQVDAIDRKIKQVEALKPLIKAKEGLANSLNKLSGDTAAAGTDDMIRKIEEQAALNEARLDIAMEDAAVKNPGQSAEVEKMMEQSAAEDILRQMELDMGIEGGGL